MTEEEERGRATIGEVIAEIRDLLQSILVALGGEVLGNADAWNHEHCTVATPGEPRKLDPLAPLPGYDLVIRAMLTNSGSVYIGKSRNMVLDPAKRITLQPNEVTELKIKNADLVWLDAQISDEGVEYWSEVRK